MSNEKDPSERTQAPVGRDDRQRWAKDNLEKRLVDGGMSADKAHERAARIARESEQKNSDKKG